MGMSKPGKVQRARDLAREVTKRGRRQALGFFFERTLLPAPSIGASIPIRGA